MNKNKSDLAKVATIALISSISVGCYSHVVPDTKTFIAPQNQKVKTATVFVDCNGTFYPSGWNNFMHKWSLVGKNASLLNYSNKTHRRKYDMPKFRALIESDEEKQLNQIKEFTSEKDGRVFIFVHGYNNTELEAKSAYEKLEDKIAFRKEDKIIRFHWDGLNGTLLGGAPIWFNAVGYSQPAGTRGLRRVLEQISDKDIYIFCHSRGTSVVLSSLSNPHYDPVFIQKTSVVVESWGKTYDKDKFFRPDPLPANKNRIHVIAAAPAVDDVDFNAPDGTHHRSLGSPLKSFRYSVNFCDMTLNKYAGLRGSFNPTGLGCDYRVGEKIDSVEHYTGVFKRYQMIPGRLRHGWESYLDTAVFNEMLSDAGLDK